MSKNERPFKGVHPQGDVVEIFEILEEIVETKRGINSLGHHGMTPLHYAANLTTSFELKDIEPIIEKLLSLGANIDITDQEGKLPLEYLSGSKSLKLFLKKLSPETSVDMTKVLFEAIYLGRSSTETENTDCLSVMESIVDFDKYENVYQAGDKPIHSAAFSGNITAINYMYKKGYDLNCKNKSFNQPIIIAAEHGFVNTVSLLISLGVDPNTKGYGGSSALHNAATSYVSGGDRVAVIRKLIESGADSSQFNRAGETPLHVAIIYQNKNEIMSLIEHGANINAPDVNGVFPLKLAIIEETDKKIIEFLIERGAVEE